MYENSIICSTEDVAPNLEKSRTLLSLKLSKYLLKIKVCLTTVNLGIKCTPIIWHGEIWI